MNGPFDLDTLNSAEPGAFSAALAPLFEGAPRFLARLAAGRPDADWPGLFARARAVARTMPEPEQVELIDAHPRLGAPPGAVSALSFREQGYDRGATRGDVADELLRDLNARYEARFGFRYCVHVAGRPRATLLSEMAAALDADRESELHRALDAVVDIAQVRLLVLRGPAT